MNGRNYLSERWCFSLWLARLSFQLLSIALLSIALVFNCFFNCLAVHDLCITWPPHYIVGSGDDPQAKMRKLIYSLPQPRIVVIRYLFAFLNHLSQYSDENLMHPYNLAVCFGPALLPIPAERDQVWSDIAFTLLNFLRSLLLVYNFLLIWCLICICGLLHVHVDTNKLPLSKGLFHCTFSMI